MNSRGEVGTAMTWAVATVIIFMTFYCRCYILKALNNHTIC